MRFNVKSEALLLFGTSKPEQRWK